MDRFQHGTAGQGVTDGVGVLAAISTGDECQAIARISGSKRTAQSQRQLARGERGLGVAGRTKQMPIRDRRGVCAGSRMQCRSEEHTSELQSLMRISYAVFCLKKKTTDKETT